MEIYYGSETEKAIKSFGKGQTPSVLIKAYGEVKKAALMAQQEYGRRYPEDYFPILLQVCDEIISGMHDDQFPLSLRQGGAGTSLHMNINEVIANMANSRYTGDFTADPLEDIACYQSTNDTFPTAVVIVLYRFLSEAESKVTAFQEYLVKNEKKFDSILMTARTELQDALPIKLGQVFASWAGPVERDRWRLGKLKERIRNIALGGTAVGTCFSAPSAFVFASEKHLRAQTGLPLCRSQNLTDAVSHHDSLSELAGGFSLVAGNLYKMAGDLLLYTSSLSGEIRHPDLQYGSTIMPFKTNPVILEYVRALSIHVQYECSKISRYCSEGQLQLNAYIPFALESFIDVHESLIKGIDSLMEKFFSGMSVNSGIMLEKLYSSNALLNTLRPLLGYGTIKELSKILVEKKPGTREELIDIVTAHTGIERGLAESWLNPDNLTSWYRNEKSLQRKKENDKDS